MIRIQNSIALQLSLLMIIITFLAGTGLGVAAEAEKTYIEFVFDASFSMNEEAEKGKSRMDVAKEVMIDLIQNLEDRPGLEVGLRVYGSRNTKCDDSLLVQAFGPVDGVRGNILDIVRSLKPRGKTPIAYSLEQAAQDFPSKESRNIIVLITDGQESCGGDPCAVSYYLQSQGIIYKPHVVGFAMSAADEAKVSCIGTYYSAKDRKSLSEALGSIMRKVVQPSTLEIEAWAGGQNVTSQAMFEITDASGDTVGSELRPKGDSLTRSLAEGIYTIKGTFKMGTMVLEAVQSDITLGEGESKRVRLDFGDPLAKLRVEVMYRGASITKDTRLQIIRRGDREASYGTGNEVFYHEGAPGEVDLKVTYMGAVSVDKDITGVILKRGEITKVTVELDDLLGTLRVKVKAGDKDVTSKSEVMAQSERHKLQLSPKEDLLVAIIPADFYGVQAMYQRNKSNLAEVTVQAGKVTDVTLEVEVPGRIAVVPMTGDKPASLRKVQAWFYRTSGQETAFEAQDDRLIASMRAGTYDIRAKYDGVPVQTLTLEKLEVKADETKEVKVVFEPVGRFRVKLTSDGKPYTVGDPRLMLYPVDREFNSDDYLADLEKLEKGLYELELKEGSYDIKITHLGEGFADKKFYDFEIKGGKLREETLDIGDSGRLRFNLVSGGKPHREGRIMVYEAGTGFGEYICDLEEVEKGVYENKLKEGNYDIELINLGAGFPNKRLRDIEVVGGSTTEKTLELGGLGRLRLNLVSGGKPHREGRIMVYEAGTGFGDYVCDLEEVEKGVYENKLKEGNYDIELINLGEGFPNKKLYDVEVVGGSTTEKTFELGGIGRLRIKLVSGGKPHREGRIIVYEPGTEFGEYVCDLEEVEKGVYENKLKEANYDIELINLGEGFPNKKLYDVEVVGGSTTEKTLELGGIGRIQVRLIGEEEYEWIRLMLYTVDDNDYVCDLEPDDSGRWAARLREGEYNLEITDGFNNQWVRGLIVEPDRTLEKSITLSLGDDDWDDDDDWDPWENDDDWDDDDW